MAQEGRSGRTLPGMDVLEDRRRQEIRSFRIAQACVLAVAVGAAVVYLMTDLGDWLGLALVGLGAAAVYEVLVGVVRAMPAHVLMAYIRRIDRFRL